MAYTNALDPTTPTDASPASEGDNEIRLVKAAILERMGRIIVDTAADPWVLKPTVFPSEFSQGTLAARPNPPADADQLYYATDTDQLFASRVSGASFAWHEVKAETTEEDALVVYSAGESRFAPDGDETGAERVKAAIGVAKLTSAPIKVVYVPKAYWGYVAHVGYDPTMYDSTVLLVREGGIVGWYDPIAYGADPTGTTNSQKPQDVCFEHAAAQPNGGIGTRIVAYTVVGTYLKNTDVDRRGCAVVQAPGVTHTGAGAFTGTLAWQLDGVFNAQSGLAADRPASGTRAGHLYVASDSNALSVWDGTEWTVVNPVASQRGFVYDADAGGNKASESAPVKVLYLRVQGTTNGSGQLTVDFDDAGFPAALYSVGNIISVTASHRTQAGGAAETVPVLLDSGANSIRLDVDGGAQSAIFDLVVTFSA